MKLLIRNEKEIIKMEKTTATEIKSMTNNKQFKQPH